MNTALRFPLLTSAVLATLATLSALPACSSGDIPVGSTNQALQKRNDGSPTGDGKTCSWDGIVSHDATTGETTTIPSPNGPYVVGDTFKSLDGCNDCSCTENGIACTERACAPGGGTCSYDGKTYNEGDSFKSADNCNTCGCQKDGSVTCTLMACAPAACKKTGCSGELCSDQDVASTCQWSDSYACYQTATCERQANGSCGFTQTAELTQCLASTH
jgi:hypothetical protein